MAIETVYCHVLHSHVPVVTDLEGGITRVICDEYDKATGDCRLRTQSRGSGPLSQLLERVDEGTLNRRATRCELLL